MIIKVIYPETDEGKKLFNERFARAQVDLIKEHIEILPLEPESKLELFDNVKLEFKKRAESGCN